MVTNVYGPSSNHDQKYFFEELSGLKNIIQYPWIIMRDFNVTWCPEDRQGQPSSFSSMLNYTHITLVGHK